MLSSVIYQFINIRGKDTLNKRNWKSILLKQISNWRSENIDCGRYETEVEQYDRLIEEIVSPKIYLEDLLNHPVNYLCWPGGGSSELSWQIAREAGYLATTVRSHPNQFGKRIDMIDRLSIRLVNIPVIGREINKILFKYAISKYTQKFPYYQLWVIKRILRNQSIQKPVKFGPSKEY